MEVALDLIAGVSIIVFGMVIIAAMVVLRRSAKRRTALKKHRFEKSSAPGKPELETTQKVQMTKSDARPVIRNTQLRGKPRRNYK